MLNNIIIYGLIFIFFSLIVLFFLISNYKYRTHRIEKYSDYMAILQINLEKAYNMIYKEKVLVYSLEAIKLPEEQLNAISRDFVALVIKFLGPKLYKEYILLYGDYETFTFNILDYFNTKYEEDGIRKDSINDLMNTDIEDQNQINGDNFNG